MVSFYVRRIKTNKIVLDDVPAKWKEEVKETLRSEVANGTITEEEYELYTGEKY